MIAAYFPPFRFENEFLKIIKNNERPTSEWADKNGEPWEVVKVLQQSSKITVTFSENFNNLNF